MKFRITPLTIFILLLVILVVLIVFHNSSFLQKEGFVSFLQNKPEATQQTIPQYNPNDKVYKLYDNLYFDNKNGSLIDITSTQFTGNVDLVGNTITTMAVLPRGSSVSYTYEFSSPNQKISTPDATLASSYTPLIHETDGVNTDTYSVLYMPWGKKTFLHVLDTTTTPVKNEASFLFSDTSVVYSKLLDGTEIYVSTGTEDLDTNNSKEVSLSMYNSNRKVHQLSKFVHYDMKNGNIIVAGENESIDVYKRGEKNKMTMMKRDSNDKTEIKTGDNDEYKSVDFDVQMYQDKLGGNTVMALSQSFETMVAIVGNGPDGKVTIKYLQRFNPNGIDDGSQINTSSNEDNKDDNDENDDLDLNDYMLKTQIVPPVCPACPSCPACDFEGACSNCGGNGGSGTLSKKGESTVQGDDVSKKSQSIGDAATGAVGTAGEVASGTVGAVGNVATGAVGAAGDVATGAFGAVGDVASGALGAVGDVASGIVGAGKKVIDAAADNTQRSGTGPSAGASSSPNQQMTQVMPQGSTDPYSYYGQLPYKKPSEYMPITADFSSFGK